MHWTLRFWVCTFALVLIAGCSSPYAEPELSGRYIGDVEYTIEESMAKYAYEIRKEHRTYYFEFEQPDKYIYEGQVHVKGTFKRDGNDLLLTPDQVGVGRGHMLKPAEANQFLLKDWSPHSTDAAQLKRLINWVTSPMKLKVSKDGRKLHDLTSWRGVKGKFFWKKV